MSIAVVDQSLIDRRSERIQRFVDHVRDLQVRLNQMLEGNVSNSIERKEPVSQFAKESSTKSEETSKVVTADDVDIDAIINSIDLDGELDL